MTKRLSDRQAEVDQRYVQMEHHRATLTAAQDAAEHAAVVCKNNFDTLTYAVQNERAERIAARKDVKEFRQDVKHLRSSLVYVFWTWGLSVAVVASFLAGMMNQITASLWAALRVLVELVKGWSPSRRYERRVFRKNPSGVTCSRLNHVGRFCDRTGHGGTINGAVDAFGHQVDISAFA